MGLSNADMRSLLISKADLWTELAKDQAWAPLKDDVEDTFRQLGLGNDSDNSSNNLIHSLRGFYSRSPERIGYEIHERIGNIINNFERQGWHKSLQQEPPHKFACLMARPDESLVRQIKEWTEKIPDEHLGKGGRESDPHVTIKFGFQDDSVEVFDALTAIVQSKGPIEGKLQGLEVFSPNEDGDVLHVKVQSKMLIDLNKELSEKFACVDTHPDYKPHLTLAYLNPEFTTLYEKSDVPFLNQDVVFGTAVWSNRYRDTTIIPLYKQGMGQLGQKTLDDFRRNQQLMVELARDGAWDPLKDLIEDCLEGMFPQPQSRSGNSEYLLNMVRAYTRNQTGPNSAVNIMIGFLLEASNRSANKDLSGRKNKSLNMRLLEQFIQSGDLYALSDYLQDEGYNTDLHKVESAIEDVQEALCRWVRIAAVDVKPGDRIYDHQYGGLVVSRVNYDRETGNVAIVSEGGSHIDMDYHEIVQRLTLPSNGDIARHLVMNYGSRWGKDLSAFNNNLGGALVPPPAFAGRKPIAPSPFRKRVMKGKV